MAAAVCGRWCGAHMCQCVRVLHRLYQQLQRDQKGLPGLTQSNRRMWEQAIEAACRAGRTEWALQVCLLACLHDCLPVCLSDIAVKETDREATNMP